MWTDRVRNKGEHCGKKKSENDMLQLEASKIVKLLLEKMMKGKRKL